MKNNRVTGRIVSVAALATLMQTLVACDTRQSPSMAPPADSPAAQPAMRSDSAESESEAIMALERAWSAMYAGGDIEGIREILVDEIVLLAPRSGVKVGRDAVVVAMQAMIDRAEGEEVSVVRDPMAAFVSESGDMAYDYGRVTTSFADGSTSEGSYLVVWKKERGVWKVAADIFQ